MGIYIYIYTHTHTHTVGVFLKGKETREEKETAG